MEDRRFAVNKVMEIRKKAKEAEQKKIDKSNGRKKTTKLNDIKIRDSKTPGLNMNAESLKNLILWDSKIYEPALTDNLKEVQLREYCS